MPCATRRLSSSVYFAYCESKTPRMFHCFCTQLCNIFDSVARLSLRSATNLHPGLLACNDRSQPHRAACGLRLCGLRRSLDSRVPRALRSSALRCIRSLRPLRPHSTRTALFACASATYLSLLTHQFPRVAVHTQLPLYLAASHLCLLPPLRRLTCSLGSWATHLTTSLKMGT